MKHCQYYTGYLLAFCKMAIKILKQGVKFVQTYQKCTASIDFRLDSDSYKPWTPFMPYSSVTNQTLKSKMLAGSASLTFCQKEYSDANIHAYLQQFD